MQTRAMSFELVFKKWLSQQTVVSAQEDSGGEEYEKQVVIKEEHNTNEEQDEGEDEGMPQIDQEIWEEADIKEMPVLQKMVDLPSNKNVEGEIDVELVVRALSPQLPSLQKHVKEKKRKRFGSSHLKHNRRLHTSNKEVDGTKPSLKQTFQTEECAKVIKTRNSIKQLSVSCIGEITSRNFRDKEHRHSKHDFSAKNINRRTSNPKHGNETSISNIPSDHLALNKKLGLSDSFTPVQEEFVLTNQGLTLADKDSEKSRSENDSIDLSEFRRTCVLSPERDLVEPDSTSEIVDISVANNFPHFEVGVDASKGIFQKKCVRNCRNSCEVSVHVEEVIGECDSTSMVLASPSAISPASQGEIEERMCPVLTDQEDGSGHHMSGWSPSHCICHWRSLPHTSSDVPHSPVVAVAKCRNTINNTAITCGLTVHENNFHAPDLDKMPVSPDQSLTNAQPGQSPPQLHLPDQDCFDCPKTDSTQEIRKGSRPRSDSSEAPPPLTKYEKHINMQQPSGEQAYNVSPPILTFSLPLIKIETPETPPCLTKYEAESIRPGVIKIRTKNVATHQELNHEKSNQIVLPKRVSETRKRHTIDSPESATRLRKQTRQRGAVRMEQKNPDVNESEESNKGGQFREGGWCQERRLRVLHGSNACLCCQQPAPKQKRRRRNTVQLCDVMSQLSADEQNFVSLSASLFRLQTRAHNLVCTLFPRLVPHLAGIAPETPRFEEVIDSIIGSLQRSDAEESIKDSADLSKLLEDLNLSENQVENKIPVFLPQVVLCRSPQHILVDFQEKMCTMLQLLLPELTVSLSSHLFLSPEELELMLDMVIKANNNIKLNPANSIDA